MGKINKKKVAVFLDRDGVINKTNIVKRKPYPPSLISSVKFYSGVKKLINILKLKGFLVICITNQPDPARENRTNEKEIKINDFIKKKSKLDHLLTCWHPFDNQCECRKPKPGLIFYAQKKFNLNLKKSFFVGDRWRDINAGYSAGCQTLFISRGYSEKLRRQPNRKFFSSRDALLWIIKYH